MFYYGGPSHLDTWDMKPAAPAEIRGPFRSIASTLPGVRICEHMPACSRVMAKVTIGRSVHHKMTNHNSAAVEALCGRTPLRGDLELLADDEMSYPCHGSMAEYTIRRPDRELTAVALPHVMRNVVRLPGQDPGILGPEDSPFQIEADPSHPNFRVNALDLPSELSMDRLVGREQLLKDLDALGSADSLTGYQARALGLIRSAVVRRSLDIDRESAAIRDRYGRHRLGQSMLMARRLVESGVPFVTVYDGINNGQDANWDSHAKVFDRLENHLLPPADQSLAAFIEDLDDRGLLETTLVVAMGEFGRTPKVNTMGGRDHWPNCYSVLLAGGGVRRGSIFGASDKIGAYPDVDPVTPGDLAATIFWALGVDHKTAFHDKTGRPYELTTGEPIQAAFA
jgi:hypothetical protein